MNESKKELKDTYCLLTREDLMQLDSKEPFWLRLRWGLFILFWIVWIGLLLAAILIIVFTPKCPPRPDLPFWRSTIGYWVNPFAFKDSSGNKVGDLRGLVDGLDYIKGTIGAGFIVLTSIFSGEYTNEQKILGLVNDFYKLDDALGDMEDFKYLVKSCHKKGIYVVLTMDFNSVSTKHLWTEDTSLLEPYPKDKKFSRLGGDGKTIINGVDYYSVFGPNLVDLNLRESGALSRVIDVAKFWLNEGIDGIVLDNAAFYVENSAAPNDSLSVGKMRKLIDEVSQSSGKPKLLAVDAGNTGYGVGEKDDSAIKFLGTKEIPGAHVVVSRQFVKQRGWKASVNATLSESNIFTYSMLDTNARSSLALIAASTSDPRQSDIVALASTLLLPGTTLLYYGTELNVAPSNANFSFDFYPFDTKTILDGSSETSILSQLPMPWDQSGIGFSAALFNSTAFTNYIKNFNIVETVESATASGRGVIPFSLVQSLVTIRKNESILWGGFNLLKPTSITENLKFQIFERKAVGFPAFIIVLRNEHDVASGTFSFSSVCSSIVPRIIYPPNDKFTIGEAVTSERVYLHSEGQPLVYVFECA
ncbi:unnamed protein product [Heterobilharzia americana]|nr:unnamed protein product [Heterobilharzia americana]